MNKTSKLKAILDGASYAITSKQIDNMLKKFSRNIEDECSSTDLEIDEILLQLKDAKNTEERQSILENALSEQVKLANLKQKLEAINAIQNRLNESVIVNDEGNILE